MLIILEGMDGAGKSALAGRLTTELQRFDPGCTVTTFHKGPPTAHPLDEYLTPLLDYRPGTGHHWILDRWHVGERVYPWLRSRLTALDEPAWWYLNSYVRRLGGVVVHCQRSRAELEATYRERGEERELAELDTAIELFDRAFTDVLAPKIEQTLDVDSIIHVAAGYEKEASRFTHYVTLVGTTEPRYLLLGDIRHGLDRVDQLVTRTDRRPAFVPHRVTSGHWLLEVISSSTVLRASTALANACDVDDVYQLWRDLGKPKLVTLGRNAHREVNVYADMTHGQVTHPQWGKRFAHHQRDDYRDALVAALETRGDYSKWYKSSTVGTAPMPTQKSSTPSGVRVVAGTPATVPSTT